MRYDGPRRKSKLQKACEALDPRVRIEAKPFSGGGRYYNHYEVRDGAGVVIGWTDGNESGPRWAWLMALGTLQRRARGTSDV